MTKLSPQLKSFLTRTGLSRITEEHVELLDLWQSTIKDAENKKRTFLGKQARVQQFLSEFQDLEKSMKLNEPRGISVGKLEIGENTDVRDCLAAAEVIY